MKNTKKASLTAKQFVTILISLVGFIIVLFLFSRFNWQGEVDEQACHESVVFRGTMPDNKVFSGKELIPLNCKTKDVCISLDNDGDCENLGKDFNTIRINGNDDEKIKQQIKSALSQEMADCWGMMGEGKLQLFSRELKTQNVNSKAFICSIVEFDNSVKDRVDEVEGIEEYMLRYKAKDMEESYLEYITGRNQEMILDQQKKIEANTDSEFLGVVINTKELYSPIYIEGDQTYFKDATKSGAIGAGAAIILVAITPVGWVAGAGIGVGAGLINYFGWTKPEQHTTANIIVLSEYSAKDISKYKIDEFAGIT